MQCTDSCDLNSESASSRMPSVTFQKITAMLQRTINSKTVGCTDRGPHSSFSVTSQQRCWSLISLDKPRGNDANDTVMPMTLRKQ